MSFSYLEKYGSGLISNGYKIVPIKHKSKAPGIGRWPQINADENQLAKWLNQGFKGVGVLCKNNPAVDIDILDEEVSSQMVDFVLQNYPGGLVRVGKAPKTLLSYRTDNPFKKVRSSTYKDCFGDHHAVEILGDGQQYVAYADHPDTLRPYEWHGNGNGESPLGIFEVESNSLKAFNLEDAQVVVAEFEKIANEKVATGEWEKIKDGTEGSQTENEGAEDYGCFEYLRPPLGLSDQDIQKALASIAKPEYYAYEKWIRIGMALWHQTNGSEEGFEYWLQWSEQDPNFKSEEDLRSRWPGFRPDHTRRCTTFATVLRWASKERMGDDPLMEFKNRYVYVTEGDSVHDLEGFGHDRPMLIKEFRNFTANIIMEIETPAPTQVEPNRTKTKLVPVHERWLKDPERKSAQGFVYSPGKPRLLKDRLKQQWINTFHLPEFANPCKMVFENGVPKMDQACVNSLLATFFRHMEYIIPEENEREWFYSWMAFKIQKPDIRCKVTPLLIATDHGTGRGWIVQLMSLLLGSWNCKKTKMSTLSGESNSGQFQEFMNDSLLCCVEEIREGEKRYGVAESIRDYLTETTLEVNIKYGAKQTKPVYTNFLFNSNHADALKLTAEDRRINVFRTVDEPKEADYYDRLYGWLELEDQSYSEEDEVYDRAGTNASRGVACLFHWLKSRDLTGFDWTRSMHNKARQHMIENNQSDIEYHFLEMVNSPPHPVMAMNEIVEYLGEQCECLDLNIYCHSTKGRSQIKILVQQHLCSQTKIKLSRQRDPESGDLVPLEEPKYIRGWSLETNRTCTPEEIRKMYEER